VKRRPRRSASAIALVLALMLPALVACGAKPSSGPVENHRGPDGFVNPDGSRIEPPLGDVMRFNWKMFRLKRTPVPPDMRPMAPDIGYLQKNRTENTVTWIGHSTVLLQLGALNVLTDPVFSKRASPLTWWGPKRRTEPGLMISELPKIDLIVISHDHYDHLDEASVRQLIARDDPQFVVPLGIDVLLREWGAHNVVGLDWWQVTHVMSPTTGLDVTLVPAQHWGRRGLFDRNQRLWGGFVIDALDFKAYFAGDTGYDGALFKQIGEQYGPFDISLIPIGSYDPRDFLEPQHVDPVQAVQIHKDVRSAQSIAVHWGTFDLSLEQIDAPRTALLAATKAAGLGDREFVPFRVGETGVWRVDVVPDLRGTDRAHPRRQWRKGEPR
jgi:N-acyl-phosphatidylethanolamine-hydrolysing phospholipase D